MSSPVSQLQWESGLDYIYVATRSSVKTFNLIALHFCTVKPTCITIVFSILQFLNTLCTVFTTYRFFNSLWRNVLTLLIVKTASVTTTHCVGGVLWSRGVLEGPSATTQWNHWDGCRTLASVSQLQSLPISLSWITLRLWVLFIICIMFHCVFILTYCYPKAECDSHSRIASTADKWELPWSASLQT